MLLEETKSPDLKTRTEKQKTLSISLDFKGDLSSGQ